MSPLMAWLFIAEVAVGLWLFWLVLNWTFDLIERAHQRLREQAEAEESLEATQATEGKVI